MLSELSIWENVIAHMSPDDSASILEKDDAYFDQLSLFVTIPEMLNLGRDNIAKLIITCPASTLTAKTFTALNTLEV